MISHAQMLNMQRVQNRALRFITNTSLTQRVRSETLHNTCNIGPLNLHTCIHILAKKARKTMQHTHPKLYQQLVANTSWYTSTLGSQAPEREHKEQSLSSPHLSRIFEICKSLFRGFTLVGLPSNISYKTSYKIVQPYNDPYIILYCVCSMSS